MFRCVNALNGLFSFLQADNISSRLSSFYRVNALNGLFSFLPPNAGSLITAKYRRVNALNGLFSFLPMANAKGLRRPSMCQCPKRAFLISTYPRRKNMQNINTSVNALNGLFSFLQYPLETLVNTGFPASFLQAFVRLF